MFLITKEKNNARFLISIHHKYSAARRAYMRAFNRATPGSKIIMWQESMSATVPPEK